MSPESVRPENTVRGKGGSGLYGLNVPRARQAADRAVFLDLLLDATQDGIVDWDLVTNDEAYNLRFRHLLGFGDDATNEPPLAWRRLLHPDDADRVLSQLNDHLADEWPFVTTVRMRHWCGGYRTILLRGAAQRDAERHPLRMVIIFSDISERVELERRNAALAAALPDTLFRLSHEGRILELKRGDDHPESPFVRLETGRKLAECLPAAALEALEAVLATAANESAASKRVEITTPRGPGLAVHHEIRVVRSGELEWVCIVRDVTEQHALAERLLQSEKLGAIGQLAAGVAHEINTPMQYVGDNLHFAQTAVEDLLAHGQRVKQNVGSTLPEPLAQEFLRSWDESAESGDVPYIVEELPRAIRRSLEGITRVTTIVRALKTFAHPSGREFSHVELGSVIESTVAVATNEWKFVAVVEVAVDPDLPAVRCAGGEISQVILNLLVNAAHAIGERVGQSGDKGRITIAVRRVGDDCELRVTDTGTGIPEHARSRVFEPFFTTKDVGKGTGQGLAMAHSCIVNRHHGSIGFETELGVGTTFIVTIPVDGPADSTEA